MSPEASQAANNRHFFAQIIATAQHGMLGSATEMPLTSLIYVSNSTLTAVEAAGEVEDVVSWSQVRNASWEVTGALLFTGHHFAQVIEGRAGAIGALMASIRRDWRHKNILVVHHEPSDGRLFDRWSLAYSGPSNFVAGKVVQLLHDPPRAERIRATGRLMEMMLEFTRR